MKFNWGTGIFIFLILFLMACAAFMVFAFNQDVNLVHKDYYEQGVVHTEQMKVDARSVKYNNAIKIINLDNSIVIDFLDELSSKIDSGEMVLFRPSDSKKDVSSPVGKYAEEIVFSKEILITGRYILKFKWYSDGIKYNVNKPFSVQ